jgi:glucose-6-phosphate 1-epimerase
MQQTNVFQKETSVNTPNMKPVFDISPGAGDLPRLALIAPDGAHVDVYIHGAQVTSWVPAGDRERLFLSRKSQFLSDKPIRGGVPVVFPQFAALGPLPMHGFARLMPWEYGGAEVSGDRASATFRLRDTEESRRLWSHAFLAELTISIGRRQMEMTLGVTNTGTEPFTFTTALHTYLSVSDSARTSVEGLVGLLYRDSAASGVEKIDNNPQVNFTGEVNRIYFDAPAEVRLVGPSQTTIIRMAGFSDTVVWNPAAAKCAVVPDLEADDYRRFVCVEAATIRLPLNLAPGERWQGAQALVAL